MPTADAMTKPGARQGAETVVRPQYDVWRPFRERVITPVTAASRAKQSFKAECNINTIMEKYRQTGLIEHVARYGGRYEDVANSVDLQTAYELQEAAEEAFASLPAAVRREFDNDPVGFLEFVENPDNLEKVRKMGLGRPKEPANSDAPAPAPSVSPPAKPPAKPPPAAPGPPAQ